jgi:hypothetical protein
MGLPMKKISLFPGILLALCVCLLSPSVARALEGGGSHYFGGNEDFGAGSWPPPGLSANLTELYFNYDRVKGSDGHSINVPGGFRVEGVSSSLRFMYVSKIELFGGNPGAFLTPALIWQRASSGGRSRAKTEVGDLNFGVVLKRDWKTFSHVIGTDFFAPTGEYMKDDVCNIGVNYWTLGPTYSFTYAGDMESPLPGFEVSARFAYYFHTTNPATDYRSGQEFSFDYLVGQRFGQFGQLRIGANGHVAFQTTDDSFSNQPASFDGHKSEHFTIGPAVQYFLGKGLLTLKAQFGVHGVNRPDGAFLWLKFWYPFY